MYSEWKRRPVLALVCLLLAACSGTFDGGGARSVRQGLGSALVVNECKTGTSGYIELYNSGSTALELANDPSTCWFVDDTNGGGAPKRITDTVTNHAAGSTTCANAGRPASCGLVAPGERVWVAYSYVNSTTADECRLITATLSAGVCGTSYTDLAAGGSTASTVAGQCFGRQPDGSAWKASSITCTPNGASNGGCITGAACDDGNACTTGETFDATCSCTGGAAVSCDDANACTADSCNAATGCAHAPLDGIACGTGMVCQAGACVAACNVGAACDDGNACTSGETFDASCACGGASAVSCDDSNPCTADSCDAANGCGHAPLDGLACGTGRVCQAGICVAACNVGAACDDGNACTTGETLGADCTCAGGAPVSCDDFNACTSDSCSSTTGCAHATLADGSACGSNLICQQGTCVAGSLEATMVDGAENRVLLTGTLVVPGGSFDGEILVEGTVITCVAASCSSMPGAAGATRIDTHGVIVPGLIDSHNHGLFNTFDENDWTPSKLYTNHNQWTQEARYKQVVDAKQYLDGETTGSPVDYRCEMDKYAEMKSLIAGTTSQLIAPGVDKKCFASLVRTIDGANNDLGVDKIQTSISVPSATTAQTVCNNFASGKTNRYVVHVAEGIDQTARNEFATLSSRASGCLLSPDTTIVHGTALGLTEFQVMAQHQMKLVWSPRSNEFLYGATAQIQNAVAAGVQTIALAPDWSIGGSRNMLDELRYARAIDQTNLGGLLGDERLVRMATLDAAVALGVDAYVGSLEVNKRADLFVIPNGGATPYQAVFAATPETVRLVMVDGRVLYGDAALAASGPAAPGCEALTIGAKPKFACVAETATTDKLNQTFADIQSTLVSAFQSYDATFLTPTTGFSPIAPLW